MPVVRVISLIVYLFALTQVGLFLLVMHRIHELGLGVAEPILRLCYYIFLEYSINKFILNASTDGKSQERYAQLLLDEWCSTSPLIWYRYIPVCGKEGDGNAARDKEEYRPGILHACGSP